MLFILIALLMLLTTTMFINSKLEMYAFRFIYPLFLLNLILAYLDITIKPALILILKELE